MDVSSTMHRKTYKFLKLNGRDMRMIRGFGKGSILAD
jgi:hypothetical protein